MVKLDGLFEGWTANGETGIIHDQYGNWYYKDEIKAIFYYRELAKGFEGSKTQISSLKNILEKKIENVRLPEVVIDWGEIQERYIHPHFRK